MPAQDVVAAQVDAYNRRDLEAFLACYAADAEIRSVDGTVLLRGHDEVRERYGALFAAQPTLCATIVGRLAVGGWVVDDEHVTGADLDLRALVAYRVTDRLIDLVVMLARDPVGS